MTGNESMDSAPAFPTKQQAKSGRSHRAILQRHHIEGRPWAAN